MALGLGTMVFGQDTQQNPPAGAEATTPGWHRFGEHGPAPDAGAPETQDQRFQAPQSYPTPSSLTVPAGTWITVRVNQVLSSDHNQPGDAFTATLVEPLVVQGLVIAHRGQTISGRVAEAEKAGRVKGTSSLGVELTELRLADGQQIPVRTQLMERRGDTSVGRDVEAVGVTTGLGAAIGAAAGGGWGAGIGALAGAAAGTTGVLATRGRPTVIYPETVLTFRLEQTVTVTSQSMQAFQPVSQEEYNHPMMRSGPPAPAPRPAYGGPAYGGAYYPAPAYYGYGYGPNFYFSYGPGFFYGRGYHGRRW
ncbi:MAG: hypothetical protein JWO80_4361 [Bryobacterales bacterium]|nr:hypothetical protein [Bryobacterales bacterium]